MQADHSKSALLPDPASGVPGLLKAPAAEKEGFALDDLAQGAMLEVETRHHMYQIKNLGDGRASICGHPEYCPEPVEVDLIASDWGGDYPRFRFIGKDARLEFWHPTRGMIRTSRVLDVRERKPVA